MDIKSQINELTDKIKSNASLMENFGKHPEQTIEKLLGIDIPDGVLDKLVAGVKAKLAGGDLLKGAGDLMKKLF